MQIGTRSCRGSPVRLLVLGALLGSMVVVGAPRDAVAKLRPLVRVMLENLAAVDEIGQGIAVEDFERVDKAASGLRRRAVNLKRIDIRTFGFDPAREARFDAYLTEQAVAAEAIASAASLEDAGAALQGLEELFRSACLACHVEFREPARLLRPAVPFMTTFLAAWREVNRGLALGDFRLVERSAREIERVSGALRPDAVIESTFQIRDEEQRRAFRGYLRRVESQANLIGEAAGDKDSMAVVSAVRTMWESGCVPCHQRFR